MFLVVADESVGRSVPFVFLERVKDDFKQRYGASIQNQDSHPLADDDDDDDLFEDRFSIAYNLDREFGFVYAGLPQIFVFWLQYSIHNSVLLSFVGQGSGSTCSTV